MESKWFRKGIKEKGQLIFTYTAAPHHKQRLPPRIPNSKCGGNAKEMVSCKVPNEKENR